VKSLLRRTVASTPLSDRFGGALSGVEMACVSGVFVIRRCFKPCVNAVDEVGETRKVIERSRNDLTHD